MAPNWCLALLLLSLMLVGVLANDPFNIAKKGFKKAAKNAKKAVSGMLAIDEGLNDLKKMMGELKQNEGCMTDVNKYLGLCVGTVAKDFPEFKKMVDKAKAQGDGAFAMPKDLKLDVKKECKPTYALALCLSRHLCQSLNCKAVWVDRFIAKGKSFLKPLFTNKDLCKGKGNVDDLGCKGISDFRKLNKKCTDKIKDKAATCKKDAKEKAKNKAKGSELKVCLETYYHESCIAQAKCDKCDSIVGDVAQTVAQAKVDAIYITNCTAVKPRSAKCVNIGVIVGASVGGVLGLCLLIGICCCCCKSAGGAGAKSSASSSPAKGKSKAKMQGQSKMAAKSKA